MEEDANKSGEAQQATSGAVAASFLSKAVTVDSAKDMSKPVRDILSTFDSDDLVNFIVNLKVSGTDAWDVKDSPSKQIRYGSVVEIADPIRGYFVAYAVACGFIIMGELNAVAPLIAMFFMMTYAILNYACFYFSISRSPGWRPSFKYYNAWVCLAGAILCIVCMFLTDIYMALAAMIIAILLWQYVSTSEPAVDWGPATHAKLFMDAVKNVMRLRRINTMHAKTFRPNYLILVNGPTLSEGDKSLVRFGYTLRKGGGLAILGHVKEGTGFVDAIALREGSKGYYDSLPEEARKPRGIMQRIGLGYNKDKGWLNYTQVVAPTFSEGGRMLISCAGLGALRPNTVLMRFPHEWVKTDDGASKVPADGAKSKVDATEDWFRLLQGAMKMRMHVAVTSRVNISEQGLLRDMTSTSSSGVAPSPANEIHIYWILDDGGITLLIPFLMKKAPYWSSQCKKVQLIGLCSKLNEGPSKLAELKDLLTKFRFSWEADVQCLCDDDNLSGEPARHTIEKYENLPGVQKIGKQKQEVWTNKWLRIGEILKENTDTVKAAIIYITMPFPRSWMEPRDYMGWCEMLTTHERPIVFIRGNGHDVMTNQSE